MSKKEVKTSKPIGVLNDKSKMFFKNNTTFLPVTMKQFEELTNEILTAINMLSNPHFLEADYMAQVLMSAIHAMDHKYGTVRKSDLFESCLNRISCHVTYHAVEEIQKKIKAKALETGDTVTTIPTPVTNAPTDTAAEAVASDEEAN